MPSDTYRRNGLAALQRCGYREVCGKFNYWELRHKSAFRWYRVPFGPADRAVLRITYDRDAQIPMGTWDPSVRNVETCGRISVWIVCQNTLKKVKVRVVLNFWEDEGDASHLNARVRQRQWPKDNNSKSNKCLSRNYPLFRFTNCYLATNRRFRKTQAPIGCRVCINVHFEETRRVNSSNYSFYYKGLGVQVVPSPKTAQLSIKKYNIVQQKKISQDSIT